MSEPQKTRHRADASRTTAGTRERLRTRDQKKGFGRRQCSRAKARRTGSTRPAAGTRRPPRQSSPADEVGCKKPRVTPADPQRQPPEIPTLRGLKRSLWGQPAWSADRPAAWGTGPGEKTSRRTHWPQKPGRDPPPPAPAAPGMSEPRERGPLEPLSPGGAGGGKASPSPSLHPLMPSHGGTPAQATDVCT